MSTFARVFLDEPSAERSIDRTTARLAPKGGRVDPLAKLRAEMRAKRATQSAIPTAPPTPALPAMVALQPATTAAAAPSAEAPIDEEEQCVREALAVAPALVLGSTSWLLGGEVNASAAVAAMRQEGVVVFRGVLGESHVRQLSVLLDQALAEACTRACTSPAEEASNFGAVLCRRHRYDLKLSIESNEVCATIISCPHPSGHLLTSQRATFVPIGHRSERHWASFLATQPSTVHSLNSWVLMQSSMSSLRWFLSREHAGSRFIQTRQLSR